MTVYHVTSAIADVHGVPDATILRGKFETQLLHGEGFAVTEEKDGWCKGTCAHDGYEGWVERKHLSPAPALATHAVTAITSHCYGEATMKSRHMQTLGFGSLVGVTAEENGFARLSDGTWIYAKHILPVHTRMNNIAATALKFLETPYYWGGRSGFGIDCSGLVQVVLARAGIKTPRDSDMQEKEIGRPVETPVRGDIVFFPGHVGIMADESNLIHANAFHMKVTVEPLADVVARGSAITSIKRLVP